MNSYLEEPYRGPYETWKAGPDSPESNAAILKAIDPIVQKGVKMYGDDSPLSTSQGKLLALDGLNSYDPEQARLQSHLLNQMQGLRRKTRQQHEVVRVPERLLLESNKLRNYSQELQDELGREPTDAELSDKLGLSQARIKQIREFQPGMSTGQAEGRRHGSNDTENFGALPASQLPGSQERQNYWVEIVYMDLPPTDQKILEYSLGLHGQPRLSNGEIAKKVGISQGGISQRKAKIQKLLDQEYELSPFLAE